MPEIDKYCGIFKTLGDKRLKTHLLCGLEKILEIISKLCVDKKLINDELLNELK